MFWKNCYLELKLIQNSGNLLQNGHQKFEIEKEIAVKFNLKWPITPKNEQNYCSKLALIDPPYDSLVYYGPRA